MFKFFHRLTRKAGIKNKYAIKEIKDTGGKIIAAVLADKEENLTQKERLARFNNWKKAQGI